ncbi:ABC transporter ATP-binding protein/permease [Candidatus Puniceispirillum sp.]|nr:ABC transporter ATP-binding protein/permease [Alphaproteobacteria bacterium]MDC1293911.1 ABC transporter ATP-binding protein/permease [Candidatus Puniceispirillum sp.]
MFLKVSMLRSSGIAVRDQIKFFRDFKVVSRLECFLGFALGALVIAFESLGFMSIYPVVSFIENGSNVDSFNNSSAVNTKLVSTFEYLGIDVSLIVLILFMFSFIVLRQCINFTASTFNEKIKAGIGLKLGALVLKQTLESDYKYIATVNRGNFIVTINYECQAVASVILVYLMLSRLFLAFAAYFFIAISAAPIPAIISLSCLTILGLMLSFLIKRINVISKESVITREAFVNSLSQVYAAWKEIKLGGTESDEQDRYHKHASKLVDLRLSMIKNGLVLELIFVCVVSAALLGSLYLMVEIFEYNSASIILFVVVMLRLMPLFQNTQNKIAQLAQYDPSLEKIRNVLNESGNCFEDVHSGHPLVNLNRDIALENVVFGYDNRVDKVLNGLDVLVPHNKVVCIMGRSGAGKSTLADLLTRILPLSSGDIQINEKSINDYSPHSLRKVFTVVSQETFLFNETIFDNLIYGASEYDSDRIKNALKAVDLLDFVNSLPNGLGTVLQDGIKNLSGGQKQRLSIARALIRNKPVLILDESTSALDQETEKIVIKSLSDLVKNEGKTVIFITHKKSMADLSDFVMKIKNGRIESIRQPQITLKNVQHNTE